MAKALPLIFHAGCFPMLGENRVREVHCDCAAQFLRAISPNGTCFRDEGPDSAWVFRGLGDDSYRLLPSALRRNSRDLGKLHDLAGSPPHIRDSPDVNASQIYAEGMIVRRFFDLADAVGLTLPEDSQTLRSKLDETTKELLPYLAPRCATGQNPVPIRWPPLELRSLIGLAQHYGLPTRLLDWTRSAYVAAYFAASMALKEDEYVPGGGVRLAVWALSERALAGGRPISPGKQRIEIVTAPRAGNPNLHAQSGLFTICDGSTVDASCEVDLRPLEEIVFETIHSLQDIPLFWHFTLPKGEACKLLWLLAKEGITAAQLFPGYGGVVEAMKEELRWKPN